MAAVTLVTLNAKVWAACTSVLYTKFAITTTIQGGKTFAAGGRPPEDSKLSLAKNYKGVKQTYGLTPADTHDTKLLAAKEEENRWKRIIQNDLESIPLGLLVFGAGVLTQSNEAVHLGAMMTFTVARCAHTYVYARSMQPHRSIFWTIGVLSVFVGVGNVVATGILAH